MQLVFFTCCEQLYTQSCSKNHSFSFRQHQFNTRYSITTKKTQSVDFVTLLPTQYQAEVCKRPAGPVSIPHLCITQTLTRNMVT